MNKLHSQAIEMRLAGYSYNMIKDKLGVSKSTLSNWLNQIPFTPNKQVLERIGAGKLKSALFKQKIKLDSMERAREEAKSEIGKLSKRDLFMLGIGVYIGEGDKTFEHVKVANSDPKIIKLAIKWFCDICGAKKANLRPRIHLYPDNDIDQCLKFWSKILNIPISQFGKTSIDARTDKKAIRKNKLPHGTLHLKLNANGLPYLGVLLHRKIMAWIEESLNQIAT